MAPACRRGRLPRPPSRHLVVSSADGSRRPRPRLALRLLSCRRPGRARPNGRLPRPVVAGDKAAAAAAAHLLYTVLPSPAPEPSESQRSPMASAAHPPLAGPNSSPPRPGPRPPQPRRRWRPGPAAAAVVVGSGHHDPHAGQQDYGRRCCHRPFHQSGCAGQQCEDLPAGLGEPVRLLDR